MHRIEAEKRLSKLEFEADEDWDTYPRTVYSCPCGENISINLSDLDKHSISEFSNLSPEDNAAFSISADKLDDCNSFLDFYCPECKTPVRIYYQSWAGGRYTHGHILRFVLERADS